MLDLNAINKIIIYAPLALGVIVSVYLFWLKQRNKLEAQKLKKLIWFFLIFNIVYAAAQIYIQYRIYANDPFTRLMLPPYQSWRWFEQYSFFHFVAPFLAALLAGIFLYYIVILINPVRNSRITSRFLRKLSWRRNAGKNSADQDAISNGVNRYYKIVLSRKECLLLPLAALAVKWPNFALYIILVFILAMLAAIVSAVRQKKLDADISISMENIMIGAMLITLLFGNEIGKYLKIYLLIV